MQYAAEVLLSFCLQYSDCMAPGAQPSGPSQEGADLLAHAAHFQSGHSIIENSVPSNYLVTSIQERSSSIFVGSTSITCISIAAISRTQHGSRSQCIYIVLSLPQHREHPPAYRTSTRANAGHRPPNSSSQQALSPVTQGTRSGAIEISNCFVAPANCKGQISIVYSC